jgi:CRP-like cAMP-binding protein
LIRFKAFKVEGETSLKVVIRNLKGGMQFLFNTPILRSLFYVSIPVVISFGLSNALLLPFAVRALGATEFEYGIQEGMTSLGFVAGSLLMAGAFDRMREGPWIAISYLGMGLAGIAYALATSIPLAIVLVTISGFLNAPSMIGRRVVIQRNTPREMRGRVNSAFFVSRDVMFLIGMAAAGLADVIDVRIMYLISSLIIVAAGVWVLFLPGLRQEAAEWRKAIGLLRGASKAPGLEVGRPVMPADLDLLIGLLAPLSALTGKERESLMAHARVVEAPAGTAVLRVGESGEDAYFILAGRAIAGVATPEGSHRSLSSMQAGDFFGEIAALTGASRTADVVTEEPASLLLVPGQTLRGLMGNPVLSQLFLSKMSERLARTSLTDLPRFAGYDQDALRELRTVPAE